MFGLNKVILIGHVGANPESRETSSGDQVTSFSLATTSSYKDKDGEYMVEWHKIETWGKLAKLCADRVSKGSTLYIEGRIKTDKFTGKDGDTIKITKIKANSMLFLDKKEDHSNNKTKELPF